MARGDDPYKIIQSVGDKAYKIELLGDMNISSTFNLETSFPTLRMKMREMKI